MEVAAQKGCILLRVSEPKEYQIEAIKHIISAVGDVFVSYPTGAGKSLIYQAAPGGGGGGRIPYLC